MISISVIFSHSIELVKCVGERWYAQIPNTFGKKSSSDKNGHSVHVCGLFYLFSFHSIEA